DPDDVRAVVGHLHPYRLVDPLPLVPGDGPGTRLTDGQAHLVQQLLGDSGTLGDGHPHQARRADVPRGGGEGQPHHRHQSAPDVAASTESWIAKTRSRAVIRKTFSSFSLVHTRVSSPPAVRSRRSAPTRTPRPDESRNSTRSRSTTTRRWPPSMSSTRRSRSTEEV